MHSASSVSYVMAWHCARILIFYITCICSRVLNSERGNASATHKAGNSRRITAGYRTPSSTSRQQTDRTKEPNRRTNRKLCRGTINIYNLNVLLFVLVRSFYLLCECECVCLSVCVRARVPSTNFSSVLV